VQGDTGSQGIQGVQGDTGSQGIQGVKGDTGNQGIQGPKGDTGAQGIQGPKGDQGSQGPVGDDGALAGLTCPEGDSLVMTGGDWACGAPGSSSEDLLASGDTLSVAGCNDTCIAQVWEKSDEGLWQPLVDTVLSGGSCDACGDGKDGVFVAASVGVTNLTSGTYNFTSFNIPLGATVKVVGTEPLVIRSETPITIAGTLDLSGAPGGNGVPFVGPGTGGVGVAGGYSGATTPATGDDCPYSGSQVNGVIGQGPEGGEGSCLCNSCPQKPTPGENTLAQAYAWYAPMNLSTDDLVGGSGGGSGYWYPNYASNETPGGGGAGGGAILLVAPRVVISGLLDVRGGLGGCRWHKSQGFSHCNGSTPETGSAGAGGSVWIRTASLSVDGEIEKGTGILRVDAAEVAGSWAGSVDVSGTRDDLPGLVTLTNTPSGLLEVQNLSATQRTLRLVIR